MHSRTVFRCWRPTQHVKITQDSFQLVELLQSFHEALGNRMSMSLHTRTSGWESALDIDCCTHYGGESGTRWSGEGEKREETSVKTKAKCSVFYLKTINSHQSK